MFDRCRTPYWQAHLLDAWQSRGWTSRLLWPLSFVYRVVFSLYRLFGRWKLRSSDHPAVPLIVVGNVVAGGAGKTPLVIELAKYFSKRGLAVGVISRGYGRRDQGYQKVTRASPPALVGDEPLLIQLRAGCPVFVGPDRAEVARRLLASHPDTELIISDDGLQRQNLHRDVEIVVFDERGLGNGRLLPAGPLREPWPRQADLVVYSGDSAPAAGFRVDRQLAMTALGSDGRIVSLEPWRSAPGPSPLLAVAGIARPQVFFDMLRATGLSLSQTIAMPDHDSFSDWPSRRPTGYTVLCTEKDAVKLWALDPDVLAVPLQCTLPAAFFIALDTLLIERGAEQRLAAKLSSAHGSQTT